MLIFRPDWHEKKVFCYMAILPHVLFYFFFLVKTCYSIYHHHHHYWAPCERKKAPRKNRISQGLEFGRGALCCSFNHVRSKQSHPTNDMLPRLWSPSIEKQTRIEPFSFTRGKQFFVCRCMSFCLFLSFCFFWFWDI